MHLPISSKVFLNVHDAKNSKEFSRLFQSIGKQFFSIERNLCLRVLFFFCCCSFPEYVFVGYGISFCSLDGTWQIVKCRFWKKSTIVSVYGLENKTIASQESEKIFEKKNWMESYYERIFWLLSFFDLGGILNSWPFEGRRGCDVTKKAALALFRRALTDKPFVVVVIEQPSAVQTMAEFLRRYGKQLHHTWNFNFCRGSDVNSREVWRIFFVLFWDFFCIWSLNQNTWGHCGTVNISSVQLNNTAVLYSVREVLSL